MGLIKAEHSPAVVRFQWRDLEADAKRCLADAQTRGESIVQEAQAVAESMRMIARSEGYERGHAEGLADGREEGTRVAVGEFSTKLQSAIAAFEAAANEIALAKEKVRAEAVVEMIDLAVAIAERVIKRQAALDPQVLLANLREALVLIPRQKQIRLAIHPSQRQALSAAMPELANEWPVLTSAQIVDDASLVPGGCRVFTEHGQIDADLKTQLDRVVAELLPRKASKGEAA